MTARTNAANTTTRQTVDQHRNRFHLGAPFYRPPAREAVQVVHEQQVKLAVHVEDFGGEELELTGEAEDALILVFSGWVFA